MDYVHKKVASVILVFLCVLAVAVVVLVALSPHRYFWLEIDAEPKTAAVGDVINLNIRVFGDSVSINKFEEVLVGLNVYSYQDNIENVMRLKLVRILRDSFTVVEPAYEGELGYLTYDVSVFVDNQGWENIDTALFEFAVEAVSTMEDNSLCYHGTEYAYVAVDLRG